MGATVGGFGNGIRGSVGRAGASVTKVASVGGGGIVSRSPKSGVVGVVVVGVVVTVVGCAVFRPLGIPS